MTPPRLQGVPTAVKALIYFSAATVEITARLVEWARYEARPR